MILNRHNMKFIFVNIILILTFLSANAQAIFDNEADYEKAYQQNIKKTHIDGVYIPASIAEAFTELELLAEKEDLLKFASAPEEIVSKKLHFGLGRWIMLKWNFYTGSRLSHLLKEKGIPTPDFMGKFIVQTFHRHLNNVPLDMDTLIADIQAKHVEDLKEIRKNRTVLKEETRQADPPKN